MCGACLKFYRLNSIREEPKSWKAAKHDLKAKIVGTYYIELFLDARALHFCRLKYFVCVGKLALVAQYCNTRIHYQYFDKECSKINNQIMFSIWISRWTYNLLHRNSYRFLLTVYGVCQKTTVFSLNIVIAKQDISIYIISVFIQLQANIIQTIITFRNFLVIWAYN